MWEANKDRIDKVFLPFPFNDITKTKKKSTDSHLHILIPL